VIHGGGGVEGVFLYLCIANVSRNVDFGLALT